LHCWDEILHYFVRNNEAGKQEILNIKKNAEVLLAPNPNSTWESFRITVVFEGKTLIFENCKPTLPIVKRLRATVKQKPTHDRVNLPKRTLTGKDSILKTPY
jgi:hypothetical protein